MYKLVPEHIIEVYNFERKQDKMSSLGVGQIHRITSWLDEMEIENYLINDDLTIDAYEYVDLRSKNLTEFPKYIQFNEINQWFSCSGNQLISLRGCPKIVYSDFYCYDNKLTNLEYCPKIIIGTFHCFRNKIKFNIDEVRKLCNVQGEIYV